MWINNVQTNEKVIAFTFDDGPNPEYTPQLLEIFREHEAKATFYAIGIHLDQYPEVARWIHEAGHELGNHTYTHPYLTQLDLAEAEDEIVRSDTRISEITGCRPATLRPPYFDFNAEVKAISDKLGYQAIGCLNGAAEDWNQPGVQHIIDKTLECAANGSIFMFHDGYGDRSQSIEAVRFLVPELISRGYKLVTISELLKLDK